MDVIICAGLSVVTTFLVSVLIAQLYVDAPPSAITKKTILVHFAVEYFTLKVYRTFIYHNYFSPLRHLPGPSNNHWLFGQSINLLKANSPTELYIKWMLENPDAPFIRYLSFGNKEILVPNSPNAHKEILQTHGYKLRKPATWLRMTKEMAGEGVIVMEFDKHRRHRRLLNGPFAVGSIKRLEPVFQSKAGEVAQLLDRAIQAGTGRSGVIDCTDTFSKTTLDIMGITVLGIDLGNLAATQFGSKQRGLDRGNRYGFHEAYENIFVLSNLGKLLMVGNGFVPLRWLPFQANRSFKFATSWLQNYLTNLLRKRQHDIRSEMDSDTYEKKESRDLLSFLIEESLLGGSAEHATEVELVGDLLKFMIAGHDTSANALSWALCVLARRQDIQSALRAELSTLRYCYSFTDIDRLRYLDNFIKECLRLYPPAASFHREIVTNAVVEGLFIPQYTAFDVVPSVSALNTRIWGEDALEIDPTRWDRLKGDQLSPYAFQIFCSGPRVCPGRAFAYMEMKIILATIVRQFWFINVEKEFTVENPGFTLRPRGLEVRLERLRPYNEE
ncbi:cytochrome P450 [Xylariaceae sp. FL1272]|nr:cytochrome P450 [Xylariaceae sp. FL1272]